MKNHFVFWGQNEEKYEINIDGLFMYRNNETAKQSAEAFLKEFKRNDHNFDECFGTFRITITHKDDIIYFADNSGMMRFFLNLEKKEVFPSLIEALPSHSLRTPNYHAIAQFLCYGCTYNNETIEKSVILSNPNLYYIKHGAQLTEKNKNLCELSEFDKNVSVEQFIKQAISHCEGNIGCTITGGIDSRTILANLIHCGINPVLAISGDMVQNDVIIAQKIADKLGTKCHIVSDKIDESEWIRDAYLAADGREGICAVYRLNKFGRYLHKQNISLQFGGLNGEMFKNSFINQDYPFYFGKPKWERFYQYKVATYDISDQILGDIIQKEINVLPVEMIEWLSTHKGNNKADMYLNAGYEIMQGRCNINVSIISRHVTLYNPLMERRMAAYVFGENPYKLEMQSFQRREVTQFCPQIKNIETDRGLTCNLSRRQIEFLKSNTYLLKVALKRIFQRNKVDIRIDQSFEQGLKENVLLQSIETLKDIGIIKPGTDICEIPIRIVDRLFTIGMVLGDYIT